MLNYHTLVSARCLREGETIIRDYLLVPVETLLGSTLQGFIIRVDEAETLTVPFGPLEVINYRPYKVIRSKVPGMRTERVNRSGITFLTPPEISFLSIFVIFIFVLCCINKHKIPACYPKVKIVTLVW